MTEAQYGELDAGCGGSAAGTTVMTTMTQCVVTSHLSQPAYCLHRQRRAGPAVDHGFRSAAATVIIQAWTDDGHVVRSPHQHCIHKPGRPAGRLSAVLKVIHLSVYELWTAADDREW